MYSFLVEIAQRRGQRERNLYRVDRDEQHWQVVLGQVARSPGLHSRLSRRRDREEN